MHKKHGFGLVGILLVVVVIGFVGFAGWYVWNNQNAQNNVEDSTTVQRSQESQQENTTSPDTIEEEVTSDWKDYKNTSQGFGFSYPSEATLQEREDATYFQATAEKNDGNNPALNVYGDENYKIQIQMYSYGINLAQFIGQGVDGTIKSNVENVDGTEKAVTTVSSEEIQGPGYDIYWFGKDGKVISVVVYGNPTFNVDDLLSTVEFL